MQSVIEQNNTSFKFKHLDLHNERYNKKGVKADEQFSFDLESKSVDIIYLYSVFSHTTEEDFRTYLKDFSRILDDNGKIFFTTFVEEDVPDFSINPENYQLKCSGPLHIVRYEKDYLFSIIKGTWIFNNPFYPIKMKQMVRAVSTWPKIIVKRSSQA